MSNKFKVGDRVRLLPSALEVYIPARHIGKQATIKEAIRNNSYRISIDGSSLPWEILFENAELISPAPSPSKYEGHYQGKFALEDGTPGIVNVTVYGNVTQVSIIVNPKARYHAKDRAKQFFGGLAYCNPCDKFDLNTGVKVACKNALQFQKWNWRDNKDRDYRKSIYSAIRKAMGAKG